MTNSPGRVQQLHPRSNVVPFPSAAVRRAAVALSARRTSCRARRIVDGAELNARLLTLLGGCLGTVSILLAAVRFLHG